MSAQASAQTLVREATRVRAFLEAYGAAVSDLFENFPEGACGNASDLLARWLSESEIVRSRYVCGERGGKSHAWLRVGDLVIDITGDQFEDGPSSAYVGPETDFHRSFEPTISSEPKLSPILYKAYERLANHLRADI